jgi:hypothetical protein
MESVVVRSSAIMSGAPTIAKPAGTPGEQTLVPGDYVEIRCGRPAPRRPFLRGSYKKDGLLHYD